MWTSKNRARYDRSELRYPSDLTDDEWKLVEPLIPPGKTGGGKRTVIMREVVNGLMYILSTGCQWRAIPKDLPPRSSVYDYFDLWTYDGTLERIHHALYERCREQAQRETSPTAAIIDSQSVKSEEIASIVADVNRWSPHANAERPEPIPYRPETGHHTDRGDRNELVKLARCRHRAWRQAPAIEEAPGRRERIAEASQSLARGSGESGTQDRTHCSCLRGRPGWFLAGALAQSTRHRSPRYPRIECSSIA